ncbi:hypothetical protein TorRG33x02_069250 [Trema orientale]|uniref:Uncharacterized protein n=1 Tax=Trema orientale TaxID=63057 RepID=A0A2P5FHA9_TREOI|nr:hypothetical protein TorRG33x02_069250 [Trema orientale]
MNPTVEVVSSTAIPGSKEYVFTAIMGMVLFENWCCMEAGAKTEAEKKFASVVCFSYFLEYNAAPNGHRNWRLITTVHDVEFSFMYVEGAPLSCGTTWMVIT